MEEDMVYLGGAWDASQSHVQKQGFTSASQEVIQVVLSKEWGKQREFRSVGSLDCQRTSYAVKKADVVSRRILSDRAWSIIPKDLGSGQYDDRAAANEPAYMVPSPDPKKYSLVGDSNIGLCGIPVYLSRTVVLYLL